MHPQKQITEPCELLDDSGRVTRPGYAVQPLWRYDRKKIKAGWHRIKEWDYYAVLSSEKGYGITFTIADLGYIGLAAVCWLDFRKPGAVQYDALSLLPMGRTGFPSSSGTGAVAFENMIFYQGSAHKLDEVTFHMDTGNYLAPWRITSSDGRFEMDFLPLVDRQSQTNFGEIKSIQHQVFGHYSGTVVLDDGRQLALEQILGFAEDVLNWW